jgi:hypothetical protein
MPGPATRRPSRLHHQPELPRLAPSAEELHLRNAERPADFGRTRRPQPARQPLRARYSRRARVPPAKSKARAPFTTSLTRDVGTHRARDEHGWGAPIARTRASARSISVVDPTMPVGQSAPPLRLGYEQVEAELLGKESCSELALHAVAGRIEPRRERAQPALPR